MFIAEKLKWIANTHPNKVITSFNGKELPIGISTGKQRIWHGIFKI